MHFKTTKYLTCARRCELQHSLQELAEHQNWSHRNTTMMEKLFIPLSPERHHHTSSVDGWESLLVYNTSATRLPVQACLVGLSGLSANMIFSNSKAPFSKFLRATNLPEEGTLKPLPHSAIQWHIGAPSTQGRCGGVALPVNRVANPSSFGQAHDYHMSTFRFVLIRREVTLRMCRHTRLQGQP